LRYRTNTVMTTLPFKPRRFRSTAAYYARYRVPYPEALISEVAERAGLVPGDRVLDLGCGPGMLAIAFARLGMEVVGLDPEAEMLAAARADAGKAGIEAEFIEGSSYDLGPDMGRFRLVVMGRSFHWMDRPATLARLDTLIAPDGAVVLFDDHVLSRDPDWKPLLDALSEKYVPDSAVLRKLRHEGGFQRHEAVLMESAFADLSLVGRVTSRRPEVEEILGWAYSLSVTSPEALGNKRDTFEAELRAGLAGLSPEGRFSEIVRLEALVAFRPGRA